MDDRLRDARLAEDVELESNRLLLQLVGLSANRECGASSCGAKVEVRRGMKWRVD